MTDQTMPHIRREEIQIRLAVPMDRAGMEAIAAQTWDGNDYLPTVLDEWFNDPDGAFNVITYQEQIVCLGKLTKLGAGEWWMEGLRVHPDFQGRGLARIMHHYMVAQVRQMGSGIVRFATANDNYAVNLLANETGFQSVGAYTFYKAEVLPDMQPTWWQLQLQEVNKVEAWLNQSALFSDMQHSFESHWKWQLATTDYLSNRLEAGHVYGWNPSGDKTSLQGILVVNPPRQNFKYDEENRVRLGFVDADESNRQAIWHAARGLAAALGYSLVQIHLYDAPAYVNAVEASGWIYARDDNDFRAILYSRPLSLTEQVQVEYEQLPAIE